MRDVSEHPVDSLAQRADRLVATRSGVLQILYGVENKGLALRDNDGKWKLTPSGKKWVASK